MIYPAYVSLILGIIAAIVLTILAYIFVMPKKNDGKFTKPFLQKRHDLFNFKKLYLEEILKFVYVLATIFCICTGFFLIFGYNEVWGWYESTRTSTALYGILAIVVAPIVLRLTYESVMMFILLVKNVMEINNKTPLLEKKEEEVKVVESAPQENTEE